MRSDCFKGELNLIKDVNLREFIRAFLDDCVLDYFYTVPASSSGKYHPAYALGEGGLVRHTKACVLIAEELLALERYAELNYTLHDEIIAALITHDTFKQGINGKNQTVFEHPILAARALLTFESNYPELEGKVSTIACLVATHMGQWNTSKYSKTTLAKPKTASQHFVHMCDYLASRKSIIIDVKYEPSEEE